MKTKPTVPVARKRQTFQKYLAEIAMFNPLSRGDEIALTRAIRNGETVALDTLVKANLRFVISVARKYEGYGLPLEDLVAEGNLGLLKAAQRFDETRGFKFISYAVWWIRQSILMALAEHSRVVRLPMNRVDAIHKAGRAVEKLQKHYEREPSLNELAECLDMTARDVAVVLKGASRHLSLHEPFLEAEGSNLLEVIADDQDLPPDDVLMAESLKRDINEALLTLKPREAEIIRMSFGLGGERPLTLQDIGERFQLSRERIRQIKDAALRRMRRHRRAQPLKKYLG